MHVFDFNLLQSNTNMDAAGVKQILNKLIIIIILFKMYWKNNEAFWENKSLNLRQSRCDTRRLMNYTTIQFM